MTILLINVESFSSARDLAYAAPAIRRTQAVESANPPVDRERQLRTKATMAAAASASQAAMRIVPPVGAAIANRRWPAKARSAAPQENRAPPVRPGRIRMVRP